MRTNTGITIYHKVFDKEKDIDLWDRYPINKVTWNGGKGASFNKGYEKANDITIWLFYKDNSKLAEVPISIGDIVVKGIIEDNITKQSDIKQDTYNIQTIINNDYSNDRINHIKIGAK